MHSQKAILNPYPLFARCGSELPGPVSSSGNVLTIRLVSDSVVASRGLRVSWDSDQEAGDCFSILANILLLQH